MLFAAAATGIAAGCSKNTPTQPSATTAVAQGGEALTASIAAPRPLTPVNNAPIRNIDQPVTLVALNPQVRIYAVHAR